MLEKSLQEELMVLFEIQDAPPERQQAFFSALEDLVNQITIDTVLEQLPKENLNEFLLLLEEELSGEKAVAFAKEKIPNLSQILEKKIREEVVELKKEVENE